MKARKLLNLLVITLALLTVICTLASCGLIHKHTPTEWENVVEPMERTLFAK